MASRCAAGYSRTPKSIEDIDVYAGEEQFDSFLDNVKLLINLLPHTPNTEGILNARISSMTTFSPHWTAARLLPRRSMSSGKNRSRKRIHTESIRA